MSGERLQPLRAPLPGVHLIEASAGTGKTHTISALFVRLLLETDCRVDEILVVTFTEAATAELRDRIRRRLRQALDMLAGGGHEDEQLAELLARAPGDAARRLRSALRRFDEAAVSTIHGFCRRMLLENAFESGLRFDAVLEPDQSQAIDELIADFFAARLYGVPAALLALPDLAGLKPSAMRGLVGRVVAHPDWPLLPESVEPFDPRAAVERAQRRLAGIWRRDGAAVRALLASSPGLNRRRYTRKKLPLWLDELETYATAEEPAGQPIPDGVRMLSSSALAEKPGKAPPPEHPLFDACEALRRLPAAQALAFRLELARHARREMARRKADSGRLSFDDLLLGLADALRGPGGRRLAARIRARYRAALIDEFQDTDLLQYRIIRRIFTDDGGDPPAVFLIGDPKQSIYAFRGADIYAYLQAIDDAGPRRMNLPLNWRSDPGLVRGVNALFGRSPDPFLFDEIGFEPVQPRPRACDRLQRDGRTPAAIQFRFLPREGLAGRDGLIPLGQADRLLPELVADDVCRLLDGSTRIDDRPARAGDLAVLVRENRQAAALQVALRKRAVPSVLVSTDNVYQTAEAAELALLLAAVAEPEDRGLLSSAMGTALFGLTGNAIWRIQQDQDQAERWLLAFRTWRARWLQAGPLPMLREVYAWRPLPDGPSVRAGLLGLAGGERRLTNLSHLAELLQAAAADRHLGLAGLLRWFGQQRAGGAGADEASQLRLESDEQAVRLVTVHRSKGLQYPIVYCPYLWSGKVRVDDPVVFHDPQSDLRPTLDFGSDDVDGHRALAAREAMAESLRLAYVAVTRAQHLCLLAWGGFKGLGRSPLGYLIHHPGGEPDLQRMAERIEAKSDPELLADLQALAEAADGVVAVGPFDAPAGGRYRPSAHAPARLHCPPVQRQLSRRWTTTSFSGLVSYSQRLTPDEAAGRDHDQAEEDGAAPAGPPQAAGAAPGVEPVALAELPRGARTGDMLHSLFEQLDFTADRGAALDQRIARQLTAFGFDPDRWTEPLARAVAGVLDTPLDPEDERLCLGNIPAGRRLCELEFLFPAAHPGGLGPALARSLALRAGPGLPAGYPERLAGLDFPVIQGFLRGFIDLVFAHRGCYYLADYKSNHLGPLPSDYAPARLAQAMVEHDYCLQYLLYSVALHRYLSYRLGTAYDPGRHFGGVFYLFVRGMSPGQGWRAGVFADRPPAELLEDWSGLLGEPAGGRSR